MKFNTISITLSNVDEDSASVKLLFDPPLPDNEEELEEQPCLVLLDNILELLGEEDTSPIAEFVH